MRPGPIGLVGKATQLDPDGTDLRRWLRSAERFNEAAIFLGSSIVKTFRWRSSASLCLVTSRDQPLPGFRRAVAERFFFAPLLSLVIYLTPREV